MKNLKENFKKHWKLSLIICVLICVLGAGIWFASSFLGRDASSETYVVEVTDEKGKSVKEVYLVLCAEDGTELSWLPYVTNMSGKAQFSEEIEEGAYVKVVGVPFGYKLDESVKYTFDEEGKVKIVLIEDQSVYVAKIGDTMYGSLASALGVANSSSDDVVIELLADTLLKTFTINNNYGKNITLKGNGHTITAEGGNNTFIINQKEGVVAFEGLVLKHKNTGSAFHLNSISTVALTDVEIDATEGTAYNYALINTLGVDGTTTLDLTRVNVKMAVGSPAKANEAGIIRTGNTSGTKTVNINMVDCNFDTTGATGRHGIVVMKNTVANIDIKNSIIRAGDAYAVWATEQSKAQTMTATNCQFLAETSPYSAAPIKGYAARIGNTYHLTLDHAAKAASESKKDVTITVVADITMKTCNIKNTKGATITIDGAGRTITTSGGNNAFVVGNNVAFKNLTIDHRNTGSAIHVTSAGNVKATDVYIKATEGKTYSYSLVNVLATGDVKSTLDFTRVKVVMAVESAGDGNASVIRTGNASTYYSDGTIKEDNSKIVDIKLTDCNFDTTKATGRTGITVTKNAKTTVELKNTTIKTMDAFAIRSNEQDINWNNADTKLTSLEEKYQIYPVEGYKAKIGEVFYTYKQAVDVANKAETDTEIKMLADHTITSSTINNKAGKLITLDGCGYTITSKGMENEGKPNEKSFNHALVVGNNVTLKNMKILHKNYGSAVQITDAGNVSLSKVEIDATSPYNNYEKKVKNTYTYALINVMAKGETNLDLSEVNVAMAVASMGQSEGQAAIIRTGNSGDEKTVNMTLENCNFDATQATGRNGILVMKGTVADIELKNTTIKTMDVATIKNLNTAAGEATANKDLLSVKATAYKGDVVTGYTYESGNTWYAQFADAFEMAKTATEDVEITLTKDVEYDLSTLENKNGKKITVKTDKYTLTATKDSSSDKLEIKSEAKTEVDGKTIYTTFKKALSSAQDGCTVELMQDVAATSGDIAHTISKAITINGNGHSIISTDAVNNLFRTEKDVTLKNMTIVHNGYGAAVQVSKASKLTVADVVIDAKNPGKDGYKYALINVLAKQEGEDAPIPEVTLDFTNVKVDMDVTTKPAEADKGAIIRTGNASDVKVVNINLKGSTLDATGAIDRHGIVVMAGTDATITLDETSKVLSDNTSAIKTFNKNDGKVTVATGAEVKAEKADVVAVEGYTYHAEDTYYVNNDLTKLPSSATEVTMLQNAEANLDGVKDVKILTDGHTLTTTGTKDASVEIVCEEVIKTADDGKTHYTSSASVEDLKKGYQAQIGDVLYKTLGKAVAAANEATTAATIDLLSNVEVKECTINKSMTINGNGFVMTTKGGNDAFLVDGEYQFTLNDLDIVHQNLGAIVKWAETKASGANVTLKNVDVDATQPGKDGYKYALFNILAKNDATKVSKLNFENVSVDMDVATKASEHSKKWGAIVRTGNENAAKTVEIDLENTTLDASGALGRHGILIMKGTNATVTMDTKSKVKSYDVSAIQTLDTSNGTATVATGAEVAAEKADAFEGYVMKIGNTWYVKYDDIYESAKTAEEDVTIVMPEDKTLNFNEFKNANGKTITLDTNGNTLTTTGTKDSTVVVLCEAEISGTYTTFAKAFSIANAASSPATIELMSDVAEANGNDAVYNVEKSMTIDGNGFTIKKGASDNNKKHFINVKETVTNFVLKNITLRHESQGLAIHVEDNTSKTAQSATVLLENVIIEATQPEGKLANEYALINILRDGKVDFTMSGSAVKMLMFDAGNDSNAAVIRTGNSGVTKEINITLENGTTIDTSKATGRHAIAVTKDTTANIELTDTVIKTDDVSAIKADKSAHGCANVPLSGNGKNTITVGDGAEAFEGYKLQVGDTRYVDFDLEDLEAATDDVTVTMLQDMEDVDLAEITNTAGAKITINTAGHKLVATTTNAGIEIVSDEVLITNKDTKTYYLSTADAEEFKKNYTAQIDNKLYKNYSEAVSYVNGSDESFTETITLLKDITDGWRSISKSVIIDGNKHTITTTPDAGSDNKLFVIGTTAQNVTLKNMNITYGRSGNMVEVKGASIVRIEDVNITATQSANGYNYALINLLGAANLTMKNVDVKMKAEANDTIAKAIICTGSDGANKEVSITLEGCTLDTTEATGRHGISVYENTDAAIVLNDTTIKTKDVNAIKSYETTKGQVTVSADSVLVSEGKRSNPEGYNYQDGNTWYVTKPNDKPVLLTKDTIMTSEQINDLDEEGVNVNGYCLTVTGSVNAQADGKIASEAKMRINDATTLYLSLQEALERAALATGDVTIAVRVDGCEVDVTNISKVNGGTITVETGNFNVKVTGTCANNVIIGDAYYTDNNGVNHYTSITKALEKSSAVTMCKDVEVDTLSSEKTVNTNGHKLTTTGEAVLSNVVSEASVFDGTNRIYLTIADAFEAANTATTNVTVTVRESFTTTGYTIANPTGVDVTIKFNEDVTITPKSEVAPITEGTDPKAVFTVNTNGDVTFEDVNINASDDSGWTGILIKNGGKITLDNPTIKTKDALGVDNQSEDALVKRLRDTDNMPTGEIRCKDTDGNDIKCMIGEVPYTTLEAALVVANAAAAPTTIDICSDLDDEDIVGNVTKDQWNVTLNNASNKITVDGNMCSVIIDNKNAQNVFRVYTETEFKDILLNYSSKESVVKTYDNVTNLTFNNMDLIASNSDAPSNNNSTYLAYSVIYITPNKGENSLTLKNTNIKVIDACERLRSKSVAVIRTQAKENIRNGIVVTISMENSEIDSRQSVGRMGVFISRNENVATVSMKNSHIRVNNNQNSFRENEGAALFAATDTNCNRYYELLDGSTLIAESRNGEVSGYNATANTDYEGTKYDDFDRWKLTSEKPNATAVNSIADDATTSEPENSQTETEKMVEVTLKFRMPSGILEDFKNWLREKLQDCPWNVQLLDD